MAGEKFCLKWNDFETNISHAFRELRDDSELFDVTIACCDDDANRRLIQAHKVILSACSPFFRNLLRQNSPKGAAGLLPGNPLIYLRGVKHDDMEAVLSFMYQGEVNVPQDQLNSFLSVAEDLRVKGLTQNKSNDTKPKSEDRRSQTPNRRTSDPGGGGPAAKKPRLSGHPAAPSSAAGTSATADVVDDDIQEVVPVVKSEPKEMPRGGGGGGGVTAGNVVQSAATSQDIEYDNQEEEYVDETYDESYDYYNLEDSSMAGGQISADTEKGKDNRLHLLGYLSTCRDDTGPVYFLCQVCSKTDFSKRNLLNHIESHFPYSEYKCVPCNKTFKTKNAFNVHNSRKHRAMNRNYEPLVHKS